MVTTAEDFFFFLFKSKRRLEEEEDEFYHMFVTRNWAYNKADSMKMLPSSLPQPFSKV